MVLTPLLWLMAGCLYVPWFEHRTDGGPNIREVIGQENSSRLIRPHHITRGQIVTSLGTPKYTSVDNTAIGYLTTTAGSYWVWPLCFSAYPADQKEYMVRLVFNKQDELTTVEWAESESKHDWLNTFDDRIDLPILKLNRTSPQLRYVGPESN